MELLVGGDEAFPRILKTHFMKSHECGRDKPKRPQSDVYLFAAPDCYLLSWEL